jgi:hypothetical protein
MDMTLLQEFLPHGVSYRAVAFLPVLPDVLAGLRRVQRGEGYRVGHAKSTRAEDMHPHWKPEGLPFVTHHETHLVGVWMYAQPALNRAKLPFCTTEEVVEDFPVDA